MLLILYGARLVAFLALQEERQDRGSASNILDSSSPRKIRFPPRYFAGRREINTYLPQPLWTRPAPVRHTSQYPQNAPQHIAYAESHGEHPGHTYTAHLARSCSPPDKLGGHDIGPALDRALPGVAQWIGCLGNNGEQLLRVVDDLGADRERTWPRSGLPESAAAGCMIIGPLDQLNPPSPSLRPLQAATSAVRVPAWYPAWPVPQHILEDHTHLPTWQLWELLPPTTPTTQYSFVHYRQFALRCLENTRGNRQTVKSNNSIPSCRSRMTTASQLRPTPSSAHL
ncbi:hypothetical protein VTK56DRAFT_475 [Thermocarpiscus australiensis]